nr:integrase, catalytic region, zinc finger, CCHC-type, peptidase aspartic, catalytic [Tanacetum cinerariifolium]
MIKQAVQVIPSSKQSNVVNHSETEITSDSNIIPYSQYVIESQQTVVQNSNLSAQQDALILSVIEQLKTQVVNYTKINLENKSVNDTLTAELERYKEQVKVLKEGQIVEAKNFDELTAMASKHSSSEPVLHEITPATISSGLMPNPLPSTPFVPPSRTDWDLLFQPLFDELLNPSPSIDHSAPEVIAPIAEVVGISHETSVARSPQQNGVIKRRNRTLIEAARTMLIYVKAPLFLWQKQWLPHVIPKSVP